MKNFICGLIKLYQKFLSPSIGQHCRFYPSCSSYAAEAIKTKGAAAGLRVSFIRILKCHPFHPGGYDPVESRTKA